MGKIVVETCNTIATHLLPKYVKICGKISSKILWMALRHAWVFNRLHGLLMVHM